MKKESPHELNKIVGGCGPGKLGDVFVPDTFYFLPVTEACRIHDYMYYKGKTPKDKWKADLTFLCNLIVICWNHTETPFWKLKFTLRALRAIKYFVAVALGGDSSFGNRK